MFFGTYLKKNFSVLSSNNQKEVKDIRNQKRYVPFADRPNTSSIPIDSLLMSQGVKDCNSYQGIPMGKSVYDYALYPMIIWESKPATIFEIGSGEGASAMWMADICNSYKLNTHVISIDIEVPDVFHEGVWFSQGDITDFNKTILSTHFLCASAHPWIIVEDAHVNTNELMKYIAPYMVKGDYMIIEDTRGKKGSTLEVPETLLVDTYYCDYFGRNATSSVNTILRKGVG
jgi:cephalosporin hydroxylase